MIIDQVQALPKYLRLQAHARAASVTCPNCGQRAARVHSRYTRRVADIALGGRRLVLHLQVRRFFCPTPDCPKATFAEQVPGLTRRYARRSTPAAEALTAIGLALAGRAGARLAGRLGLRIGRSAMLRTIRAVPIPADQPVTLLGIDDFALRRGHRYGTVLINMATRRPIDLLPDREAATVGAWLAQHPGVEIICRDRAGAYAEAARTGAPTARQVADRWHLWKNLGDHVERAVARHQRCLTPSLVQDTEPTLPPVPAPQPTPPQVDGRLAERTRERYQQVQQLRAAGKGIKPIMRELGLAKETVRRYARAPHVEDLLTKARIGGRISLVDPYAEYLQRRWAAGCTTITILHQEIRALGYRGGYGTLRDWLRPWQGLKTPPPAVTAPKTRQITSWIMQHPDRRTPEDQSTLTELRARCAHLDRLATHVADFATILTQRQGHRLDDWITTVQADDLPELHSFAHGLLHDHDAVVNGLTLPYSSGAVEGNVNRIILWNQSLSMDVAVGSVGPVVAFGGSGVSVRVGGSTVRGSCRPGSARSWFGVGPAGVATLARRCRRWSTAVWSLSTAARSSSVSGMPTSMRCRPVFASSSWPELEDFGV